MMTKWWLFEVVSQIACKIWCCTAPYVAQTCIPRYMTCQHVKKGVPHTSHGLVLLSGEGAKPAKAVTQPCKAPPVYTLTQLQDQRHDRFNDSTPEAPLKTSAAA